MQQCSFYYFQNSPTLFWKWAHGTLLPGLYHSEHYNTHPTKADDLKYISNTFAIRMGPARLRQLRVKPGNSDIIVFR